MNLSYQNALINLIKDNEKHSTSDKKVQAIQSGFFKIVIGT